MSKVFSLVHCYLALVRVLFTFSSLVEKVTNMSLKDWFNEKPYDNAITIWNSAGTLFTVLGFVLAVLVAIYSIPELRGFAPGIKTKPSPTPQLTPQNGIEKRPTEDVAKQHYDLAMGYFQVGSFVDAISEFTQVLKIYDGIKKNTTEYGALTRYYLVLSYLQLPTPDCKSARDRFNELAQIDTEYAKKALQEIERQGCK